MLLGLREVLISAGIVQLLICCAQCKPQGSTVVLSDADCADLYSPSYCLNGNNTCSLCPEPSSGCPEGFYNPSGPSTQCFKYYGLPGRSWEDAREFCIGNGMMLATPNDDVNLEELSTYLEGQTGTYYGVWLGGRWSASTSGFLWEAGVGEQPGSSIGRREMDKSHPGWCCGGPGSNVGNDSCLLMRPIGGSTPYGFYMCSQQFTTLCQL